MEESEGEGRERPPSPPGPAGPAASCCGPARRGPSALRTCPCPPSPAVAASAPALQPFGISVSTSASPPTLLPILRLPLPSSAPQ